MRHNNYIKKIIFTMVCSVVAALLYSTYYWFTHANGREFGTGFGMGTIFAGLIASAYITLRYGD